MGGVGRDRYITGWLGRPLRCLELREIRSSLPGGNIGCHASTPIEPGEVRRNLARIRALGPRVPTVMTRANPKSGALTSVPRGRTPVPSRGYPDTPSSKWLFIASFGL